MTKPNWEDIMRTRNLILKAFKELRKDGLLARSNFLCCSTCASYELTAKIEEMKKEKRKRIPWGYVFWHKQDNKHFMEGGPLYLRFVGMKDDDTVNIGKLIVHELKLVGLCPVWNGNANRCIEIHA